MGQVGKLKQAQKETLLAIYKHWVEQKEPMPKAITIRGLMPILSVKSTNTVNYRVQILKDDGLVMENERFSPGVRLTEAGWSLAKELYKKQK